MKELQKRRLSVLWILFLWIGVMPAMAQLSVTKVWDKTYGGNEFDNLNALLQTADGGYLLGGRSNSSAVGDKSVSSQPSPDFWLVKTDAMGNKLWDKTYSGGSDLYTMVATPDNGFLLGGISSSEANPDKTDASRGLSDFWVVKINASGDKTWDRTFGGSGNDHLYSMVVAPDGGFILAGYTESESGGDRTESLRGGSDFWVVKINAEGVKMWDKRFGGSGNDGIAAITVTRDGGYILGGYSYSEQNGDKTAPLRGYHDFWLVKINSNGEKQWDKTYGGGNQDAIHAILPGVDGGYLLGGTSASWASANKTEDTRGGTDFWLVKIDEEGNRLWDKTLGSSGYDVLNAMALGKEGGYLVGGLSESNLGGDKTQPTQGDADFWVVRITREGTVLWDKRYGGRSYDKLTSILSTPDGGFLLGGDSRSGTTGDKTGANKGYDDYWLIKLENTDPLAVAEVEMQSRFLVYPNPSNGTFTVKAKDIELSSGTVQIILQDVNGTSIFRQICTLSEIKVGLHITTSAMSKGVYLLQLQTSKEVFTQRIVLF